MAVLRQYFKCYHRSDIKKTLSFDICFGRRQTKLALRQLSRAHLILTKIAIFPCI